MGNMGYLQENMGQNMGYMEKWDNFRKIWDNIWDIRDILMKIWDKYGMG